MNYGTVTPPTREKLEREIAALIETCAKPRKLRDMLAALEKIKAADRGEQSAL